MKNGSSVSSVESFEVQQHQVIFGLCLTRDLRFRENERLHLPLSVSSEVSEELHTMLEPREQSQK